MNYRITIERLSPTGTLAQADAVVDEDEVLKIRRTAGDDLALAIWHAMNDESEDGLPPGTVYSGGSRRNQ